MKNRKYSGITITNLRTWVFSLALFVCSGWTVHAQTHENRTVVNTVTEEKEVIENDEQVITNFFHDNWFILGDAGVNAYWGDCTDGSLSTRLTPQFNIGFGKWFVPGFGMKIQFTGFRSKANKGVEGLYTRGSETYYDKEGNSYWKERIKWWDFNLNMMFNISRLICSYEGIDSPKLKNQFIASLGIGATHHYDLPYGSANEWSGHVELQYSRFFSRKKDFSLDVRLRGIFYETKFDGVFNHQLFDENISLNVGFTYYFKNRGWGRTVSNTTYYVEDMSSINQLNAEINRLKNATIPADTVVVVKNEAGRVTFPYLVNFVIDKVEVVNREKVNLKVVADMIKATPEKRYLICGYADKHTGTVERNIWLAEHRAKNVFQVLTDEFGVKESQLVLDDKGGVENMYYDDPQLSRSVIISEYKE